MTFTTATPGDIPLIQALAERIWWPTYGPLQPKEKIEYLLRTFYSPEALANGMSSGDQKFVLLYDEEEAMGFASYGFHAQKPDVARLHKLYVLPAIHGKGYGRGLLEEIKRRVRQSPAIKYLELNVYRGNPALLFYEKAGFKIMEEVNIPVGEYFFEDYVMRLGLEQD